MPLLDDDPPESPLVSRIAQEMAEDPDSVFLANPDAVALFAMGYASGRDAATWEHLQETKDLGQAVRDSDAWDPNAPSHAAKTARQQDRFQAARDRDSRTAGQIQQDAYDSWGLPQPDTRKETTMSDTATETDEALARLEDTYADRLAEQEDNLPPESIPGQRSAAEHLRAEAESFDAMARNDRDAGEPPVLTDQWEAARDELNAEADRIEDAADERAWDAASLQDGVQDALNEASRAEQMGNEPLAQWWREEAADLAAESQATTTGQGRNVPAEDTAEPEAAADQDPDDDAALLDAIDAAVEAGEMTRYTPKEAADATAEQADDETPRSAEDRAAGREEILDQIGAAPWVRDALAQQAAQDAANGAAEDASASDAASGETETDADPKDREGIDWDAVMADLDQIPDADSHGSGDAWGDDTDTDTDTDHDREVAGA